MTLRCVLLVHQVSRSENRKHITDIYYTNSGGGFGPHQQAVGGGRRKPTRTRITSSSNGCRSPNLYSVHPHRRPHHPSDLHADPQRIRTLEQSARETSKRRSSNRNHRSTSKELP